MWYYKGNKDFTTKKRWSIWGGSCCPYTFFLRDAEVIWRDKKLNVAFDFNYGENTQRYEHTFCLIACYELIVKHSANRRRHRRQIEIIITATRFSVTYINKLCTQCYRVYHLYHRPQNANTLDWIGFAPMFDFGTSLWFNQIAKNIKPIKYDDLLCFYSQQVFL